MNTFYLDHIVGPKPDSSFDTFKFVLITAAALILAATAAAFIVYFIKKKK